MIRLSSLDLWSRRTLPLFKSKSNGAFLTEGRYDIDLPIVHATACSGSISIAFIPTIIGTMSLSLLLLLTFFALLVTIQGAFLFTRSKHSRPKRQRRCSLRSYDALLAGPVSFDGEEEVVDCPPRIPSSEGIAHQGAYAA